MMDARWIIVRDRQAGLLAEAEAERLARQARAADAERQATEPTSDQLEAIGTPASRRLVPAHATHAAELRAVSSDCQKA